VSFLISGVTQKLLRSPGLLAKMPEINIFSIAIRKIDNLEIFSDISLNPRTIQYLHR
jgi:hypothetical protein